MIDAADRVSSGFGAVTGEMGVPDESVIAAMTKRRLQRDGTGCIAMWSRPTSCVKLTYKRGENRRRDLEETGAGRFSLAPGEGLAGR